MVARQILFTKSDRRKAITGYFLRKSQQLRSNCWADVLQSAADILISMLAGGKHTMIYQWPPLQRIEITAR